MERCISRSTAAKSGAGRLPVLSRLPAGAASSFRTLVVRPTVLRSIRGLVGEAIRFDPGAGKSGNDLIKDWFDLIMSISDRMNRMLKDRQEILVVGELLLFLTAWVLGIVAAVDDYRVRTNAKAGNNVAASSNASGGASSGPSFIIDQYGIDQFGIDQHGGFE